MPAKVVVFCATSVFAVSWQHLNYPNLFVCTAYRSRVYFYVRIILHHLVCFFSPHENCFNRVKNSYIKSAYYSICDDYGVDTDQK